MTFIDKMIQRWNEMGVSVEDRLSEALHRLETMHYQRLELDRRIHNQRASCRMTWEIVEMRRKWLGTPEARKRYHWLWKRYQELKALTSVQGT